MNLGSGEQPAPKPWINVDAVNRGQVDLIANVMRLPFRRNSVERMFAGHLLEHLYPYESATALLHWMQLLAPGGVLGIVVPDIQRMWKLHEVGKFSQKEMGEAIGGERHPDDPYALHVTVWSKLQLCDYVSRVTGASIKPLDLSEWPTQSTDDWQVGVEVRG